MGCSVDWDRAFFTMNDVGFGLEVAEIFNYPLPLIRRDLVQLSRSRLCVFIMTILYTEQTDW